MSLIAVLPIALLVALAVFSRRSLLVSSVLSLITLLAISLFIWEIEPVTIAAAATKGIMVALEIIAIIFGALLIFEVFKRMGGERSAKYLFDKISPDNKIRAVLISWAFICFLEGISGFGTPPMITVPLLISIGFSPVSSVAMSLIGDTLPVTFGAVGLPVTYGFISTVGEALALKSASLIATLNIIIAPIVVSAIIIAASGKKKNKLQDLRGNILFIIFASLAVTVPSFITLKLFGPEMPSIVGGLVGMLLIAIYAIIQNRKKKVISREPGNFIPFIPYIIVATTLVLTRIPYVKNVLSGALKLNIPSIFGTKIAYSVYPLASSAFAFIAVALGFFVYFLIRRKKHYVSSLIGDAFNKIIRPAVTLICIIIFVQIMLNSGNNGIGHTSMIESAANIFRGAGKIPTLFISPLVGALGAFIAGSSTISNLLFSSIQQSVALIYGNAEVVAIALQGIGSAVGNVVSIHNILAALAVAGMGVMEEKKVLKINLPYLGVYLLSAAALGAIITAIGLVD